MRIVTMFITIDGYLVYFSSTLPLTNISQEFITIWYFSSTLPLTNICFSLHVDLLQTQSPTITQHAYTLPPYVSSCARGSSDALVRSRIYPAAIINARILLVNTLYTFICKLTLT